MTKEALKQHCEKQVKMCEEWAKGNGREPSGKIYEEHKLILDLIKALEQQPSEDVMVIHTQGLDEGIRCAMCTNSMKSDRGCDGGCVVNEDMYKKVMDTIKNCMSTVEERKVGKWIEVWESQRDEFSGEYDEWREHKCSICGFQEMDADRFKICPNCGTKMIGNTKRKGKPIEGNNESYNCENWIP